MGVGSELDALRITVTSPDGHIKAALSQRRIVEVRFRPGSYPRYNEEELKLQLAQLGKLLWVSYRRAYDDILTRAGARVIAEPRDTEDPSTRALLDRREDMVVEVSSPRGAVSLRTKAMLRWKVNIAEHTISRMSESEFREELHAALEQLFTDWAELSRRVREEVFDPRRAKQRRRHEAARIGTVRR